jgi:hypothetical protein
MYLLPSKLGRIFNRTIDVLDKVGYSYLVLFSTILLSIGMLVMFSITATQGGDMAAIAFVFSLITFIAAIIAVLNVNFKFLTDRQKKTLPKLIIIYGVSIFLMLLGFSCALIGGLNNDSHLIPQIGIILFMSGLVFNSLGNSIIGIVLIYRLFEIVLDSFLRKDANQ